MDDPTGSDLGHPHGDGAFTDLIQTNTFDSLPQLSVLALMRFFFEGIARKFQAVPD